MEQKPKPAMKFDQSKFPAFPSEGRPGMALGLTKREYFAAMALQGLLAHGILHDSQDYEYTAKLSVSLADELLKQL